MPDAAVEIPGGAGRILVMGRILGAFGVRGWVKIAPYTETPGVLLDHPEWLVRRKGTWQTMQVVAGEAHAETLVAQLAGIDDRDQAAMLRGSEIGVPRSALPPAPEGEYYWADLEGLAVENVVGEALGRVTEVFSNGGQEVLRIADANGAERLVPFVPAFVESVDLETGRIVVDWGMDW